MGEQIEIELAFSLHGNKWIQDFILNNSNKKNNKISTEQKIIEVLVLHPKIIYEKLTEKIGKGGSDISRVLSTYTIETYRPLNFGVSGIIYNNMMNKSLMTNIIQIFYFMIL
jgi:hypothetical protein